MALGVQETNVSQSSPTVRDSVLVRAPAERVFDLFVHEMDQWWDPNHHVLSAELKEMVVEPRCGGKLYDVGVDGSVSQWGTVLVYEPPRRFVFAWHVSPRWIIEPDLATASEVEVLFEPEGSAITRVTLEHRHLERHGDGWQKMRDAVAAPESWSAGLRRLARLAEADS